MPDRTSRRAADITHGNCVANHGQYTQHRLQPLDVIQQLRVVTLCGKGLDRHQRLLRLLNEGEVGHRVMCPKAILHGRKHVCNCSCATTFNKNPANIQLNSHDS